MRAILVSVDYTDLLRITLPYNRRHFDEVMVVTSTEDAPNVAPICEANNACCFSTDLFYERGADFNKWAALEAGLDAFGRHGWLCIMDADVLWPKQVTFPSEIRCGNLCTPRRRMWIDWPHLGFRRGMMLAKGLPSEDDWPRFPLHRNEREFAGYSQIFHADDPALGPPPWHDVGWRHGGGADSFFQQKWSDAQKIRPPFEVLHLGEAGKNWFGRATRYADGTEHADADQRRKKNYEIWGQRRRSRSFESEKL